MKKILLLILVCFASLHDNVTAQINDSIDSVRLKVVSDSLGKIMRAKPLLCVVDTTTLPNAFIVHEQYRGFVFDSIPDNLCRRNFDKVLKENDWYMFSAYSIFFYCNYYYLTKYADLFSFEVTTAETLNWDKKNKWWTGRFDDPNQLFLVVLINVELLNSVYYHIEWKSEEYDYSKAKRHYPSYNPKASFVKMLLPIRRDKALPL